MIQVQHLTQTFASGRGRLQALSDISFSMKPGSAAAIIGKSGSGKTTLLNCIGGLLRPEQGRVTCFGIPIHELGGKALSLFQRKRLGFIFQHGNLLSYYTVADNMALPLILNGVGKRKREHRVAYLLERIGLPGVNNALPGELSGGEAQRVAAARAIAHSPQLILADEPTASLDSETGKDLAALLFEMVKAEKSTLILSTHDPELLHAADPVFTIRDGRIAGGEMNNGGL